VIEVEAGKTYRFRLINLSSEFMFRFKIQGHSKLTVIEMDGVLTNPVDTDYVLIHTGQRYSVLVEMNQPVDNYFVTIQTTQSPAPGPLNGVAILSYAGANDPTPLRKLVGS
jgi:iron transport multicopper oxidase